MLQHKINPKKLKPGLVASYDLRHGYGEGPFWFRCFINLSLTYSLEHYYYLLTYSPGTHTGHALSRNVQWSMTHLRSQGSKLSLGTSSPPKNYFS